MVHFFLCPPRDRVTVWGEQVPLWPSENLHRPQQAMAAACSATWHLLCLTRNM